MPISNYLGVNPAPPTVETNRYQDINQQAKVKNNVLRTQDINSINSSADFNSLLRKSEKLNNQSLKLPDRNTANLNKNYQDISKQKVNNNSLATAQNINTKNNSLGINKQKTPGTDENGTNIALKEVAQQLANSLVATMLIHGGMSVKYDDDGPGVDIFSEELMREIIKNSGIGNDFALSIYREDEDKQ